MKPIEYSEYLTHITKDGDRWDLLAHEYYGTAFATEVLLEANPAHAALAVLPSGLSLVVPILSPEDLRPEEEGPVPWR
jgi:phage tail protein X